MAPQPDDEAILAALDTAPEDFALFYRRHVAGVLEYLRGATRDTALAADLCAETFAAALEGAHRFDPARGPAVTWLFDLARGLLVRAQRRGVADARARRRLGMARLERTHFVGDLEEELVAAARFRASHPPWRSRPVRPHRRAGWVVVLAAAAAVVVAAVAAQSGGQGEPSSERSSTDRPPPPAVMGRLVPMQPLRDCGAPSAERLAAPPVRGVGLLERSRREDDALPFPPAQLPVDGYQATATRRAPAGPLAGEIHVVPSLHVSAIGRCGRDDGPGACLVAAARRFACFTAADIANGAAVALARDGVAVGIVPDGVARVTLEANGAPVTAPVRQNVYQTRLPELAGTGIQLTFAPTGDGECRPGVAPALRDRITALHEPAQPGNPLPRAALDTLNWWTWQLDAVAVDGARYWGGADGVAFWVVPVVPKGGGACAPATHVCVVAVPDDAAADAQCVLEWPDDGVLWRTGPLLPGHAVIYGVVPDGVDGANVSIGGTTAPVEAGLNVIGGVLPFPYRDGAKVRVELLRRGTAGASRPPVVVVGATDAVLDRLAAARYETSTADDAGVPLGPRTAVYWDQRLVTREAAARVAGVVGADDRFEAQGFPATPPAIRALDAPVVVVVGSG